MSDFEKFKEELPIKEKFYSSLTDRKISDKEYEHVLNVWNKFEMKTMKDYHDLYLKCDVLLLANVFEKFRNNRLKNYGLYPSHYLSVPGLSWDAMLKMTKIELQRMFEHFSILCMKELRDYSLFEIYSCTNLHGFYFFKLFFNLNLFIICFLKSLVIQDLLLCLNRYMV